MFNEGGTALLKHYGLAVVEGRTIAGSLLYDCLLYTSPSPRDS